MKEQLMASGRNIPDLYPHVDVWGFGIPLYLFIGGLAAGILLFAAYFYLKGKGDELPVTVKISTIIPPVIIALGLFFLVEDLHHKAYFWQLMTHFRIQSPMSWGAWVLTVVFVLSIIWPLTFMDDIIKFFEENGRKKWANSFVFINNIIEKTPVLPVVITWSEKNRKLLAGLLLFFGTILGIYTGILLSSMNARPLWNTAILGPIFLTSGISTGTAAIMWISNNAKEKLMYSKIDFVLILTEIVLIVLMFLGMIWGGEVQVRTAEMFFGGEFTAVFWGIFVGMGLVVPAILEYMEMKGIHVPVAVPAFLVLAGGLLFRIIMVTAGQISTYLF